MQSIIVIFRAGTVGTDWFLTMCPALVNAWCSVLSHPCSHRTLGMPWCLEPFREIGYLDLPCNVFLELWFFSASHDGMVLTQGWYQLVSLDSLIPIRWWNKYSLIWGGGPVKTELTSSEDRWCFFSSVCWNLYCWLKCSWYKRWKLALNLLDVYTCIYG